MCKVEKINRLTFVKLTDPKIRRNGALRKMGLFRCDCGNEKVYAYHAVKTGHTKQCIKCAQLFGGIKRRKHNKISHPLYRKWCDMKKRCYNPNVDRYVNYGAKGIIVCDEWKNNFLSFYNWCITNGWKKELQIDRIDVEGNYCPENCKFSTHLEQGWNKRNTFYVTVEGKQIALAEFIYKAKSLKYNTIRAGLSSGKTIEYYIEKYNLDTSFV